MEKDIIEIKKSDLQGLFKILTNYPQISKERCRFVGRSVYNAGAYGGLICASANGGSAHSNASIGSRLAFKSRELAIYCGKQFIEIWINYLFK